MEQALIIVFICLSFLPYNTPIHVRAETESISHCFQTHACITVNWNVTYTTFLRAPRRQLSKAVFSHGLFVLSSRSASLDNDIH